MHESKRLVIRKFTFDDLKRVPYTITREEFFERVKIEK